MFKGHNDHYHGEPFLSMPLNENCPRRSLSLEYVLMS